LEGLHFRSDPETSPSDLQCPDLYSWGVSEHLEASFIRAELLGFQSSSGAHHSVEDFRSTGFERDLGIRAPGLFLPSPDLLFGIFLEVIGHLWHQGRIVEELQLSSRTWHWSSSLIQPLEAYFVLSGAFCSSSIVYLLGHLLSIPDRHLHCSRFLYFMNKSYLRCFGLSIILHMVEVCSMVVSSCYLLQTFI
jgi:hypothetical protein